MQANTIFLLRVIPIVAGLAGQAPALTATDFVVV